MKYVIIGFPKSGQISLIEYLKAQGNEAEKYDMIWHDSALEMIRDRYRGFPETRFVIIIRDPIERMWSGYRFWHYHEHMTFEKYTHFYGQSKTLGSENPVIQSNYTNWLERIESLDPWLVDFEEIVKLPNFPHENKTKLQLIMPPLFRKELERDVVLRKFKNDFKNYLNKNNFKRLHFRNN